MKLAKRLLAYSLPYWRWLMLALVMIAFTALAINYLPVLIQRMTDQCLMNTTGVADERLDLLMRLSILYITIAAIGHGVRYFQGLLTAWIGQKIIYDLRLEVFRKVLRMQQAYFDRTAIGTLMTRVTSDIERLQHFVTEGVVGTIADLFMLLGIMGYMLYISPSLSVAIFIPLPLLFAFLLFINVKLRNANRDIRDRQSRLNALLQEDLTGMTTIQLFNREASAMADFERRNTLLRSAYFEEVHWFSLYFPTIEGAQTFSILLILTVGGLFILNGSTAITLGTFIAFLAYIRDFFRPLGSLADKAGSFQVAMASIERVFNLLDTPEELADPSAPALADRIAGTIDFNNVWFAYNDENWVVRNLSFSVEPGQILAVVGATGAGKSTIINLIGRFYDVQQGSVSID
ncbi:MAG: ABC transporter transmembrane domain-containing protein, partial [Verrucomicrobiota bacterium]